MSDPTAAGSPLDQIIADYLQAAEAGKVPSRQVLLDAHPEHADDLRAFFADYDRLDNRADGLKLATHRPPAQRPKVRYLGDYELLEEIAEGGMGLVYKARQETLGRIVALKLVRAGRLAKPIDLARFRIEAEAAAGLDHPNIVPLYEVGEHEGQNYLAMKFIDGPSLAKLSGGDVRTEVAMMEKVVRAVHYAHQQGILHRDIKPSNILTDTAGTPYVTDFGLAKRIDADHSLTESGQMLGTAGYIAPEQALGKKGLTVTADVFSLGAVLFERLTGSPAFPGGTILERLRSLHDAEPPRPSSVCRGLDRDLETVCLKCLEKDPAKRYATAGLLADDLAHWLRGEPVVARPRSRLNHAARWVRRHGRAIAACVGIALLIALGVRLATMTREGRDEAERQTYYALIGAARRAVESRQFYLGGQFLRDCPERLRNWEWHYLMRVCRGWNDGGWQTSPDGKSKSWRQDWRPTFPAPVALRGDSSKLEEAVINPDGRFIAGLSGSLSVHVWEAADGRERCVLTGAVAKPDAAKNRPRAEKAPKLSANHMAFSPDGSRVAFTVYDRDWGFDPVFLVVGDTESGKKIYEKRTPSMLGQCVGFSPDGGRIAVGGLHFLRVFDAASGELTQSVFDPKKGEDPAASLSHRPSGICWLTYDLTGGRLATASCDSSISVWDMSSGAEVARVKPPPNEFHYVCPRFSPDGGLLASPIGVPNGAGHDVFSIIVWETKTWTEIARLRGHTENVPCIAFSPDGSRLASASRDRTVRLWDAKTGHELLNFSGLTDEALAVAFSPDGHRLLSVSADRTVHTWDATPSTAP